MRVIYLLVLLVLLAAIGVFAWQNNDNITVRFMEKAVTYPISWIAAAIYLLGMLSGSTFIGVVRRSVHRATK